MSDGKPLLSLEDEFHKDFRMPSPPTQCLAQRMLPKRIIISDLLCNYFVPLIVLAILHVLAH